MMSYIDDELIDRARIAFAKAGATDQPAGDSDVQEVDGIPYVVLRNVNGILAVYRYDEPSLKRVHEWPNQLE